MLSLDSRTKSKLVWLATLFTPVLVVQGVRVAVGNSNTAAQAQASANPQAAALPGALEPEKPLTAAQLKAQVWLGVRGPIPANLRCPMDRPDPLVAPTQVVDPTPAAHDNPGPKTPAVNPALSNLTLTGMIAGRTEAQSLATINHHVYHVGDEVAPKWKIKRIDTRKRTVTIVGPGGQTTVLSPSLPGH